MAAGVNILLKRKAGAFAGGDLAAGEMGIDTTNGRLYASADGSTVFAEARSSDLVFGQVIILQDVKAHNVEGGTFTAGAPRVRTLNTILTGASYVSLSSSLFTPVAGTWLAHWCCPAFMVDRHWTDFYNETTTTTVAYGVSSYARNSSAAGSSAIGTAVVVANGTDQFSLRHECETTKAANGFGTSTNKSGTDSVYATITLTRLA